jgi:Leucine-rich repeat (LRR) protein
LSSVFLLVVLSTLAAAEVSWICKVPRDDKTMCQIENIEILNKTSVSSIQKLPENVREISISKSIVNYAPNGIFLEVPTLTALTYKNVSMEYLDAEIFEGSENLMELTIHDNFLSNLDKNLFETVPLLRKLDLSANKIRRFDKSLLEPLKSLKELSFEYNKFEYFSKDFIAQNKDLVKINLAHNKYIQIPKGTFDGLKYLKEVDLTGNLCGSTRFIISQNNFNELNNKLSEEECSSGNINFLLSIILLLIIFSSYILA